MHMSYLNDVQLKQTLTVCLKLKKKNWIHLLNLKTSTAQPKKCSANMDIAMFSFIFTRKRTQHVITRGLWLKALWKE